MANDWTYWANIQNDIANAQRAQQKIAEDEKRDRIAKYNVRLDDALKYGRNYGIQAAHSMGLDAANPEIARIIDQIASNIGTGIERDQDSGVNPHSFFSPTAFTEGFTDIQSRGRQANTAKVRSTFGTGYESKLMPDTDIDSIVDQILNEQRGLAQTTLDYQSKRGLLTPQGAEQSRKSLENQSSAARSTLTGLARGALDKDREMIRSIIGEADTGANNWMLGNPAFDVNPYAQRASETAARERASFGGDVRAALGDTQLFDIPSIVAQAGQAQGAQNLTTGGGAFIPEKRKSTNRGLGNAGGGF